MADATCTPQRGAKEPDTLGKLEAILKAFWAKLASRQQAPTQPPDEQVSTKPPEQQSHRHTALQTNNATRWRRRRRLPLATRKITGHKNRENAYLHRQLPPNSHKTSTRPQPAKKHARNKSTPSDRNLSTKLQPQQAQLSPAYAQQQEVQCRTTGRKGLTPTTVRDQPTGQRFNYLLQHTSGIG
ncbi:Hypothetical predicted protein [Pelobates cultripes]|uniref:Uncharacterized protein n=1 Tax=Pelobates cultripes TaxID=61616 RepID=A0AAD1S2E8_PELCU|nr:Hypothetical predicted protein [Pelobates cultripes]